MIGKSLGSTGAKSDQEDFQKPGKGVLGIDEDRRIGVHLSLIPAERKRGIKSRCSEKNSRIRTPGKS